MIKTVGNFSISDLVQFAKLSSDAYMIDSKAALVSLGMNYIAQVGNDQCQATIGTWGNLWVVAIRGTQVTQNLSIPELFDDIENDVVLNNGARIHKGFWEPLAELWP